MPLGMLRRSSTRKSSTGKNHANSEAELIASRSTVHRLSKSISSNDDQDLSSTGSGHGDQRHRSASGSGSQSRLSADLGSSSTVDGSGSQRRHSAHSSNGSCRSRTGSVEGSNGDLTNDDFKGKRRASLFPSGLSSSEARVVRVFFRDETYRSVRFMEEETCVEVLNRLWPRLDLSGDRQDYQFYLVYKKDGHRFVTDEESADVLLGSEWREVEKIYLRHRDDKVAVKRVAAGGKHSGEVMLKKSKSRKDSVRRGGSVAPNPFANATGDSHTVHVDSERPVSKFAQAFSMAWETAELLDLEERSKSHTTSPPTSPLKFDTVRDILCTTNVASQLKSERRKSNTDSGRGSLERKALAPTEYPDSGHCSLTSQDRRSISSIAADSGVSLHQDVDSPMLRKALSRSSVSSGGSPRATAVMSHFSQHASVSKLSFTPLDMQIGDAPTPPTAPRMLPVITSPGSHYSMQSDRSPDTDSPPSSPLPPPPPLPALAIPAIVGARDDGGMRFPAPPSPSLPPPPTREELLGMRGTQFSFQVQPCGVDV